MVIDIVSVMDHLWVYGGATPLPGKIPLRKEANYVDQTFERGALCDADEFGVARDLGNPRSQIHPQPEAVVIVIVLRGCTRHAGLKGQLLQRLSTIKSPSRNTG